MSDKRWKAFERRVATAFNTVRTPLSGKTSRHTSSDTLHETLYIECKSNVSHPLLDAWQGHNDRARQLGLGVMGVLAGTVVDPIMYVFKNDLEFAPSWYPWPLAYVVPHYARRDRLRSLWEQTVPKANAERKIPLLAIGQYGREGFWIVCRPKDSTQIICAL